MEKIKVFDQWLDPVLLQLVTNDPTKYIPKGVVDVGVKLKSYNSEKEYTIYDCIQKDDTYLCIGFTGLVIYFVDNIKPDYAEHLVLDEYLLAVTIY